MKIRRVRYPIKLKMIVVITLVVGAAISLYVYTALDLFKKDKSAYIYENSLAFSENLSGQVKMYIHGVSQRLSLLVKAYHVFEMKGGIDSLLLANQDFIDFSVYEVTGGIISKKFSVCNSELLQEENKGICDDPVVDQLSSQVRESRIMLVKNLTTPGKIPHFMVSLLNKATGTIFLVRVQIVELTKMIFGSNIYKSWVATGSSGVFLHEQTVRMMPGGETPDRKMVDDIISANIDRGVREITRKNGEKVLIAFAKMYPLGFCVFSEISHSKAFQVAQYLINKSFYLALLVLSVAIIIGIIFSRSITSHIQKLFNATLEIANGNFRSSVKIKSKDEVGVLADSFNYMSGEIVRYMEHMKEKARLENEMAVAKLVQSAFFPDSDIEKENIKISAFYTPATECGGDWWGHIDHDGKTILILADATGHGVPAALLTATVNSCAANLKTISRYDPEILLSPSRVLSFMNHAVCSVGGKIMLTCFVGLVDPVAGKIRFSNASHNPPLLFKNNGEVEITKSDLKPLMGALGPRLGHEEYGKFTEEEISIDDGDVLIMQREALLNRPHYNGLFVYEDVKRILNGQVNVIMIVMNHLNIMQALL